MGIVRSNTEVGSIKDVRVGELSVDGLIRILASGSGLGARALVFGLLHFEFTRQSKGRIFDSSILLKIKRVRVFIP